MWYSQEMVHMISLNASLHVVPKETLDIDRMSG